MSTKLFFVCASNLPAHVAIISLFNFSIKLTNFLRQHFDFEVCLGNFAAQLPRILGLANLWFAVLVQPGYLLLRSLFDWTPVVRLHEGIQTGLDFLWRFLWVYVSSIHHVTRLIFFTIFLLLIVGASQRLLILSICYFQEWTRCWLGELQWAARRRCNGLQII